jgi:hypothetical protein
VARRERARRSSAATMMSRQERRQRWPACWREVNWIAIGGLFGAFCLMHSAAPARSFAADRLSACQGRRELLRSVTMPGVKLRDTAMPAAVDGGVALASTRT